MTTLTANLEDRTITGLMLPFGEQGRTSLGRVTASTGSVRLPEDPASVVLNMEHSRQAPVGRGVAFAEGESGITASFRVARTRAGDDLLAEVAEGLRTGLSVELDDPVIRAGHLISGVLTACAAVVSPAFPSAQMVASDTGDVPPVADAVDTPDQPALAENEDAEGDEPATEEEAPVAETVLASAPAGSPIAKTHKVTAEVTTGDLFKRLAAAGSTLQAARLTAALDEISQADVFDVVTQPQYLGELWSGRGYIERYAPLIGSDTLTGPKVTGWRFVTGKSPVVADYAGAPNQPNSNEVDTEAVEESLARIAGGWSVDRIHKDFPSPDFWQAFFRAATDDYARKRDTKVITRLVTDSTAVTGGSVPSGVSEAAALIVDGALAMIDVALPTFAVVGSDLYREFLLTRSDDSLAYLSTALGVEEGSLAGFKIVPSAYAGLAGKVLVGSRSAATLHELPGSPIRVDAEAISKGTFETGLFGYYAILTHDARALRLVTPAA